jgi:hypothetical protein
MNCFKCKTKKGKLYFISRYKENTYYMCRECNTERHRKYRTTQQGKINTYKAVKKYVQKNREKSSAWEKVQNAVKNGNLIKPIVCEKCKKSTQLDAHHNDYTQVLRVKWLCRACHKKEHIK